MSRNFSEELTLYPAYDLWRAQISRVLVYCARFILNVTKRIILKDLQSFGKQILTHKNVKLRAKQENKLAYILPKNLTSPHLTSPAYIK